MITHETSLLELAGAVAAALREIGYDPVVVGGSASTIYAPTAYRSDDIDMVIIGGIDDTRTIVAAMASLGFRSGNGGFVHEKTPLWVEFVPSPVAIANDIIGDFTSVDTTFGPVRILRAVDAVCDRLNKFIVWKDAESLDVALAVARACEVDLEVIEDFVERHAVGIDEDAYRSGFRRFKRELVPTQHRSPPFEFTTVATLQFEHPPSDDVAVDVMTRIQRLLEVERTAIVGLGGVRVGGTPLISGDRVAITLTLGTSQVVPFGEKLRLAIDAIDHVRSRLAEFPEIQAVEDEEVPAIAMLP